MTSAADKIRENALRVKGNSQTRRTHPARIEPADDIGLSETHPEPSAAEDRRGDGDMQSAATPATPEGGAERPSAAKTRQASKSQVNSGTPTFAPRQTPVRRTVDLTPAAHSKLDDWQRKTAREIGVARVTGQEVLSTLLDEFLENPELAAVVRDSIWRRRQ